MTCKNTYIISVNSITVVINSETGLPFSKFLTNIKQETIEEGILLFLIIALWKYHHLRTHLLNITTQSHSSYQDSFPEESRAGKNFWTFRKGFMSFKHYKARREPAKAWILSFAQMRRLETSSLHILPKSLCPNHILSTFLIYSLPLLSFWFTYKEFYMLGNTKWTKLFFHWQNFRRNYYLYASQHHHPLKSSFAPIFTQASRLTSRNILALT